MQACVRRPLISLAPIFPAPIRRWVEPLDPAIQRLLIPAGVSRGMEEASGCGSGARYARQLLNSLDIRFVVDKAELRRLPGDGPAVAVCNHPHGIVEGLILASLLESVRPDYRLVANFLVDAAPDVRDRMILVNPFNTAVAARQNRAPLRESLRWLESGGLLVMFPAGEVAHYNWKDHAVTDPPWKTAAARLALRAGCSVAPIFFEGANSLGFQLAGAIHPTLRTLSLAHELQRLRGKSVRVRIGNPVPNSVLSRYPDPIHATEYLRLRTYFLANRSDGHVERKHNCHSRSLRRAVPPPAPQELLTDEVHALPADRKLAASGEFVVYLAGAAEIPALLPEIGRCRELTFRAACEGTGEALDLDQFDRYYQHLFLWNKSDRRLAGAYRLAVTTDVLPAMGVHGLYTSTLFHYEPQFFDRIGPAVELGRSFVVPEYQKSYAALLLLWKGILRLMQRHPEAAVLFGAVSISRGYRAASRGLLANYLRHRESHSLAGLVRPRVQFRDPAVRRASIRRFAAAAADIEHLSQSIADIEDDGKGVPVLVRQYLRAGGKLLGLTVDRQFSDSLDALILADLRSAPRALLDRCMGRDEAHSFLVARGA